MNSSIMCVARGALPGTLPTSTKKASTGSTQGSNSPASPDAVKIFSEVFHPESPKSTRGTQGTLTPRTPTSPAALRAPNNTPVDDDCDFTRSSPIPVTTKKISDLLKN